MLSPNIASTGTASKNVSAGRRTADRLDGHDSGDELRRPGCHGEHGYTRCRVREYDRRADLLEQNRQAGHVAFELEFDVVRAIDDVRFDGGEGRDDLLIVLDWKASVVGDDAVFRPETPTRPDMFPTPGKQRPGCIAAKIGGRVQPRARGMADGSTR